MRIVDCAVALLEHRGEELLHEPGLILREEVVRHRHPARLLEIVEAHHLQPGAVDEEGDALQIGHADEVAAVLDERHELLPIGLGALAVGDVDARRGHEQHLSRLVLDRHDRDVRDPLAAVGHEVRRLAAERRAGDRLRGRRLDLLHQRGRGRPPGTFPEPLADDLLPPVAAAFPGQPVGRDDGAVQLHDDREQRALLEERLELGVGGGRVGQQPPLALVGPPLAGDVADDLGRAHDVALVVSYRRDGERHQDAPAVLADALGLEVIDPLPGLEGGDDLVLLREAIRRNDQRDVAPDSLRRRVAEHPLGGVIPALDGPIQRLADDGVVGRLHDRRQLAGVQKLVRLLLRIAPLRGRIPEDQHASRDPAVLVPDG